MFQVYIILAQLLQLSNNFQELTRHQQKQEWTKTEHLETGCSSLKEQTFIDNNAYLGYLYTYMTKRDIIADSMSYKNVFI